MNALAMMIHRFTQSGEHHLTEEHPVLTDDERRALAAVLPLISQSPRALARLLEEGDPPDIWMRASQATLPSA